MSSERQHDDAEDVLSDDEMNGSGYQLPTLTRRQAMAGGSAAAIAVGAGMLQSDLVRAVAAQSTEPRIQLGNDWEIDDDGGDLVLNHIPTGDEIRYDESAGEWRSSVGFSIEGDWLLDSQELAGTQRLVLTGVGVNAEAELFLRATGTADRARMILTPDSSLSNYAGIKLDAKGANLLEAVAAGTATAEPLVIGVDGTSHLTLETGGDIDANQQHIKNAGAVTTDVLNNADTTTASAGETVESDGAGNLGFVPFVEAESADDRMERGQATHPSADFSGNADDTMANFENSDISVTFSTAFSTTPHVALGQTQQARIVGSRYTISTTGFTSRLTYYGSTAIGADKRQDWVAVGGD